jgi:hypothetical protein
LLSSAAVECTNKLMAIAIPPTINTDARFCRFREFITIPPLFSVG